MQLLLGPCFALSDDVKLQEKLKDFLTAVISLHPPLHPPASFAESGFYALLQDHLEKRLVLATTQSSDAATTAPTANDNKGGNSATGNSSSSSSSSSSSGAQGASSSSTNRCSAAPIVTLLARLCTDSPSFLQPHVSALVKLCHRLAREHVSATARTARALQGASGLLADLGPNGTPPRVMATPTLALLAEATCAAAAGAYTAPQSIADDPAMATLMAALKLLGNAVSDSFANGNSGGGGLLESRKVFLRLVEGLLMQSDHVPLLLTLVDLVSNWVVVTPTTSTSSSSSSSPRSSPLTPKERATFLMRLAHFPRVPEPAAAPLLSKFLAIVKRILISNDAAALSGLASSGLTCVGLMASEPQMRASFQRDYLARAGQDVQSRLAHMLSSDWEALGNRYWLAATVEFLLATVSQQQAPPKFVAAAATGGSGRAAPCRLPPVVGAPTAGPGEPTPSSSAPASEIAMEEDDNTSRETSATTTTVTAAATQMHNQHKAFLAMVAATKASSLATSVFTPLHSVLHADVNLAHWLWQQLLPQAWSTLAPAAQASLAPALASTLAKPSLRPCLGYPAPLPMMPAGGQVGRLPAGGYAQLSSAWGWSAYGSGVGVDTCGVAVGGLSQGPTSPPPNVVRSMLTAMAECRPMPVLQPALLNALSSQHYAWYAGAAILEHQALVTTSPVDRLEWVRCLAKLYGELGEHDRLRALQQRSCAARETHVALSLETYGYSAEAQSLLLELMAQEDDATSSTAAGGGMSSTSGGVGLKLSGFELELWESRWVSAARELGQWPVLEDLSKATNRPECALESAAKNHDWAAVRDQLRTPSCIAGLELGSPQHKLFEIYVAIVDSKFSDVEHHCNQCIQLALHQWATMPPLTTGDGAHVGLLRLFHQLVEVHESGQIMLEVSQQARPHSSNTPASASNSDAASTSTPDFSHIIETWRKRLPNAWESLPEWDDLLSWRRWVFTATADAFSRSAPPLLIHAGAIISSRNNNNNNGSGNSSASSDGSNLLRLHDLPWTLLSRAHAARKLHLGSVALETLAALYDTPTLDVADAYTKLREQILMCLPPAVSAKGGFDLRCKNKNENGATAAAAALVEVVHSAARLQKLKGGLTLVNNTNLE